MNNSAVKRRHLRFLGISGLVTHGQSSVMAHDCQLATELMGLHFPSNFLRFFDRFSNGDDLLAAEFQHKFGSVEYAFLVEVWKAG